MSKTYRVCLEKLETKRIPMVIDVRVPDDNIDDPIEFIKDRITNINDDMYFNMEPYIKQDGHESVDSIYTVNLVSSMEYDPDTNIEITKEYRDHVIYICRETEPLDNPRECWDNLGVMTCFHKKYDLGDKYTFKPDDFSGWDGVRRFLTNKLRACIILPLYLYDHSGITISTTSFSCPWDSGQVGFVYTTKNAIKSYLRLPRNKPISLAMMSRAEKVLVEEVKEYDGYISSGERYVYRFEVYENSDQDAELKLICNDYDYFISKEEAEVVAKKEIDYKLGAVND